MGARAVFQIYGHDPVAGRDVGTRAAQRGCRWKRKLTCVITIVAGPSQRGSKSPVMEEHKVFADVS